MFAASADQPRGCHRRGVRSCTSSTSSAPPWAHLSSDGTKQGSCGNETLNPCATGRETQTDARTLGCSRYPTPRVQLTGGSTSRFRVRSSASRSRCCGVRCDHPRASASSVTEWRCRSSRVRATQDGCECLVINIYLVFVPGS